MTKSTLTVDNFNSLIWRNEKGQYHRNNDKPAVIHSDGTKEWWIDGKLHRDNDKPARIYPDGTKEWWVNGKFIKKNKSND